MIFDFKMNVRIFNTNNIYIHILKHIENSRIEM